MRPLVFSFLALAFVACDCGTKGDKFVEAKPQANVLEPTERDAEMYLLAFGKVRAGASYTKKVVIENRGRSDWNVATATLREGSAPNLEVVSPELPAAIATADKIELSVKYGPLSAGVAEGFLDIVSDDPDQPTITVHITAEAEEPGVAVCIEQGTERICDAKVAPANLEIDFGLLALTDPPAIRKVIVRNASPLGLNVGTIALTPATSPEFTLVSGTGNTQIAPGTELVVTLSYKPVDGGYDRGQLEIPSDDPKKPLMRVDLKGAGKAPALCAKPWDLDFGTVVMGQKSDLDTELSNCGVNELTVKEVRYASTNTDFKIVTGPGATVTVLQPGDKLKVTARYEPKDLGADTARLAVFSDDPASAVAFVNLKGTGIKEPACDLQVVPTSLDFGNVSTSGFADRTLSGANTGQKACTISAFTGPTNPLFSVRTAPPAPYVVQPGQVFDVTLRFKPTGAGGQTATYTIASDDPVEPSIVVNLKGNGTSPPPCDFQIVPSSVRFGNLPVGGKAALAVELWNFGSDDCTVTDAKVAQGSSAAFSVSKSPMIPDFVGSNQKADFELTFAPTTAGNHTGTFTIKGGQNFFQTSSYSAALSGTASAPKLCITPASLDFGAVAPPNTKTLSVTLTSCGAGSLELRGINLDAGTSTDFGIAKKPPVPTVLAAGASTTIDIKYAPTTNGPDFGRLGVVTNDPTQSTAWVPIRGNAVGCFDKILNCAPTSLHFPKTQVGDVSSRVFTCANLGSQDVAISAIRLGAGTTSEFTASHRAIPPALAPGQSLRIAVDYKPSGVGTDTGTVEVVSDDCQIATRVVNLEATAVAKNVPKCIAPKTFSPTTKWEWKPTTQTSSTDVWTTPLVVNLTDDNGDGRIDEDDNPDVVFASHPFTLPNPQNPDPTPNGHLRAIDGKTGKELWTISDPSLYVNGASQLVAADLDGDNVVEIVATLRVVNPGTGMGGMQGRYRTGRLVAFENDGTFKWLSDYWTRDDNEIEDASSISAADLDNDGVPELVIGASVFGADGKLLWEASGSKGSTGHGVMSVVADLDGDGKQEVIAGNAVYNATGNLLWKYGSSDGLPIIIDVDGDGKPEVVLRTTLDSFVVLAANGTKKYGPFTLPNPPPDACASSMSAADFDGDGKPELAIPVGSYFAMVKPATGQIVWQQPIDDYSGQCGASGAAAFDFEGDGKFDAVYHDSQYVYAFRGADGTVIFKDGRVSATIWETPVIADVDNDGHADILITQERAAGVKLLNNVSNDWVATRRIWNQYGFHVTNVAENGTVPRVEVPGWTKVNGYRAAEPRCVP